MSSVNHDESKVGSIIVCNTILIVVATVGTAVRLLVRSSLSGLGLDDGFCAISWALMFCLCFLCMWMTRYGYGRHYQSVHDVAEKNMFLKLDFATMITYLVGLATTKISFCLAYLRIFPGKTFRAVCWTVVAIVVAETIAEIFVVIFQCEPIHKAWDAGGTVKGKCLQLLSFYYISFAIRLATDIALFALPIPKLMRLNMGLGKRVGLICMFGLGVFIIVTSIIRATYLNSFTQDRTWELVETLNWSCAEVAVGIFIACIPSFKALIGIQFPKLARMLGLSSSKGSTGPTTYGVSTRKGDDYHRSIRMSTMPSRTKTDIEVSANGSEEHILPHSLAGIEVTTSVRVDRTDEGPS
ncbi:integral membrane protein [Aspergillus avenaceus]|uniref:Integral membrane protein n=1 Tax=Aspergillus avenaceus TaxID=36643 RepID=A0A5N6TKV1_ASPAV|nr:integral membrane protein [Aspergillus avenaceus]